MVNRGKIKQAIPHVLKIVDLDGAGEKHSGKVRDFYIVDDKRILITTDRQSAFNYNLGYTPYKGAVLNLLSKFWFEQTKEIVSNHMIAVPDPNVMVVYDCKPIPIEMIVRGYMTGVTTTSIWYSYKRGERNIYGIDFPDGLCKNEKLPEPIITPTTHPNPESGSHDDERLTREQILKQEIVSKKLYEQMEKAALKLFKFGTEICERQGLILVDTKFEFGLHNGKLMQIDEVHTPDSSRFWTKESYDRIFSNNKSEALNPRVASGSGEPENFDKEFLRLRYRNALGYSGSGQPPQMPEDLVIDLSERYIAVYEKITGKKFHLFDYPIKKRIEGNIRQYLSSII